MVPINEYKTLDIKLDKVNSYIPPIIINEADNNGRRLKFTPTYEGQPVTGITSARMYYDPRPRDASSIGDYVDGTKDGDGWVFIIPPNTFTANVQGIASVSFTDADGETYTRSMPIYVEPGGTKIDSQGTRIDRLIATLEQMVNDFTMTADTETGPAGSQASVNVTRLDNGSYNLDFTIPTGEKGPKGDPGDLTTVAHDTTLTGDGTSGAPLGAAVGSMLNPHGGAGVTNADAKNVGITRVGYSTTGLPSDIGENDRRGFLIGSFAGEDSAVFAQLLVNCPVGTSPRLFLRGFTSDSNPSGWTEFAAKEDIPNVSALTSRIDALEPKLNELAVTQTRLQALETRIKSLETN